MGLVVWEYVAGHCGEKKEKEGGSFRRREEAEGIVYRGGETAGGRYEKTRTGDGVLLFSSVVNRNACVCKYSC